jgi:hypothetical protein
MQQGREEWQGCRCWLLPLLLSGDMHGLGTALKRCLSWSSLDDRTHSVISLLIGYNISLSRLLPNCLMLCRVYTFPKRIDSVKQLIAKMIKEFDTILYELA